MTAHRATARRSGWLRGTAVAIGVLALLASGGVAVGSAGAGVRQASAPGTASVSASATALGTVSSGASGKAVTGPHAREETAAAGTPGYCPTKAGVTVVVDFNELGGGIVVRCAPGPVVPGYTGLDALQDAGFRPEGVRRYGFAFICRIAGKPAPNQKLPIQGDPGYREACLDTPPPSAFWGYWYARNNGSWTYSSVGAMSRDAIPGGFEGWSFSLNHTPDSAPPPGIAPVRPPHQRPTRPPHTSPTHRPTHHPPTHRPPTHRPPTHQPRTHRPPTDQPGSPGPPARHTAALPPGTTRGAARPTSPGTTATTGEAAVAGPADGSRRSTTPPTTPTPTAQTGTAGATSATARIANPVAVGHNAAGERVSGELPNTASAPGSSARTTVLGLCLIAALAVGGGIAAWRRRAGRG